MTRGRGRWPVWLVVAGALLLPGTTAGPAAAAVLPSGFSDELVASVPQPTAMAWTPDGRMLVTGVGGRLYLVGSGGALTTVLDLTSVICTNGERGLLGLAVDPAFGVGTNRFVYLYYTFKKFGVCTTNDASAPVNRVSRFVLGDSNVVDPASETVLLDNMPSPTGVHNGGDLAFGKDGNLYATIGDGGVSNNARSNSVLSAKILRITPTGGIPADNPFQGPGTAACAATGSTTAGTACREIYATGLRNPFRVAFDPDAPSTRFFVNDVGQNTWEEIDLGQAGADYGWAIREGHCALGSTTDCGPPPPGLTNPIFDYPHTTGCRSITGGAFVPDGTWGGAYDAAYLYADFVCGGIFRLDPDGAGGFTSTPFATGFGAATLIDIAFGPSPGGTALYYATYGAGGEVRRITGPGGSPGPGPGGPGPHMTLSAAASPASGPAPLAVTYTYTLVNDGTDTLFHTAVADSGCSPVLMQSGDVDGDQLLDPGETWTFRCSRTYASAGTFANSATAAAKNTQTGLAVSSNTVQTTVTVGGTTSTSTTAPTSTTVASTTSTTTTPGSSGAPANLTLTSRTPSTAGISWNPVAGASEYRAYVSRTSGSGYFLWASGFTGTSATLYSLTGNFYVVVRAVVGGVESANSNEILAPADGTVPSPTTTTSTTTTPGGPTAPTNLTLTSRTPSTAGISWSPVAGASEYRAYVSRTSGSGYFLWASGFTGTSATLYSLTGNFYVVVRAVVGGVESANSNEVLAAAP